MTAQQCNCPDTNAVLCHAKRYDLDLEQVLEQNAYCRCACHEMSLDEMLVKLCSWPHTAAIYKDNEADRPYAYHLKCEACGQEFHSINGQPPTIRIPHTRPQKRDQQFGKSGEKQP